jgi:hypothetical protein
VRLPQSITLSRTISCTKQINHPHPYNEIHNIKDWQAEGIHKQFVGLGHELHNQKEAKHRYHALSKDTRNNNGRPRLVL